MRHIQKSKKICKEFLEYARAERGGRKAREKNNAKIIAKEKTHLLVTREIMRKYILLFFSFVWRIKIN